MFCFFIVILRLLFDLLHFTARIRDHIKQLPVIEIVPRGH